MLIIKTYRTGIFLDFISFLMFYPFLLASKSECADCVISTLRLIVIVHRFIFSYIDNLT